MISVCVHHSGVETSQCTGSANNIVCGHCCSAQGHTTTRHQTTVIGVIRTLGMLCVFTLSLLYCAFLYNVSMHNFSYRPKYQSITESSMSSAGDSDDWESLLDSGQLDANIKKLTILQRPKPSDNTVTQPPMTVLCDDDPRTQFKPTEPVIKIMKRPDKAGPNANGQVKPKVEQKSLKQREQEYAEARQRILGSEAASDSCDETNRSPAKTLQGPGAKNLNGVARIPKGPDGSKGFQNR